MKGKKKNDQQESRGERNDISYRDFFNERERGEKSKTVYVLISLKRGVKKYGENFY